MPKPTDSQLKCSILLKSSFYPILFREKTNKSISEYIIDVRIGRASRLLVDTARSISDICYECGFNNISNFNRIFKMRRGVSPSSFRDNYRKNKVII